MLENPDVPAFTFIFSPLSGRFLLGLLLLVLTCEMCTKIVQDGGIQCFLVAVNKDVNSFRDHDPAAWSRKTKDSRWLLIEDEALHKSRNVIVFTLEV